MEISTVLNWAIVILFLIAIILFIMALLALLVGSIVRKIDSNKAVNETALAMRGSSHNSQTQACAMVLADTSTSDRARKFFGWFANLSIVSLCTVALAFIVFLLSIFF